MYRFVALLIVLLTGCDSVDPFAVARLAAISPLEADPAGFAATAALPEGLELRRDGLILELAARRTDTGETISGRFALVPREEEGREVWRVDPGRLPEIRATQGTIRGWEAVLPDATEGHLSISVAACTVGPGPDPEGRISVFLRTQTGGPLLPLIRNARLKDAFALAGPESLSPCDEPAGN